MKAIHYINQFFGQVGGEDAADAKPIFHDGIIGCSMMLNGMMPDVEVTNTIVCGDNYITNHTEEALKEIFAWLDGKEFDMFFAGPAFMAGRYGVGCGIICKAVKERYNVPVFSSMNEENPGVAEYRTEFPIFKGGRKATFMKDDLTAMAKYAEKVAKGEQLLPAADEGYFPRGIRSEIPAPGNVMAADRVIDMLVKKLNGEPFQTELVIPKTDKVPPPRPHPERFRSEVGQIQHRRKGLPALDRIQDDSRRIRPRGYVRRSRPRSSRGRDALLREAGQIQETLRLLLCNGRNRNHAELRRQVR